MQSVRVQADSTRLNNLFIAADVVMEDTGCCQVFVGHTD